MPRSLARLALCAALALPLAAAARGPDWESLADVRSVDVITQDEDGDVRDKPIWFVVIDGQPFIRSGGSRWGDNLVRDPQLVLRVEGEEYPLRADFIENDVHREQIVAAFREKYGWLDGFLNFMRGGRPKIMHLIPR